MTLKYPYRQILTYTVLIVMCWNIAGWTAIGLGTAYMMHIHEDEHTCEMAFCYCTITEGQKICTCHHKEIHDHPEFPDSDKHGSLDIETKNSGTFCYYTATHSNDTASFQMILWKPLVFLDQSNTNNQFFLLIKAPLHSVVPPLLEGYITPPIDPPIV